MKIQYESFPFSRILGWSSSRYELFDTCKRQYFYTYYSNFVPDQPSYKINLLKSLTSVPLEIGNVVHDVLEAFLRRLQKDDRAIDEKRFFAFARERVKKNFSQKTFIELYYGFRDQLDYEAVYAKIDDCLTNFINSPIYSWLFMKALKNRSNWMIEPAGYGETRLNGLKAYCKMDFLFPVDNHVYILDWKTGKKNDYKHKNQLLGYAAAASNNFKVSWDIIFPKIVYLFPTFTELEVVLKHDDFVKFFETIDIQTKEMYSFCSDVEKNQPLPLEQFSQTPSDRFCRFCNFQELCFPDRKNQTNSMIPDAEF